MIAERTVRGLVHAEKTEDMDEELTKVIEDFDRAVNVEALRVAKETGKNSLFRIGESTTSLVSCRARASAWEARIRQCWLRFGPWLYGRHQAIYSK